MIRRIAASIAALAMLLILAVPVMAGGWAEIVADAQTTKPPVEGQPTEVGFKVMQHGVTPAPWETATVHFVDMGSGDKIDVVARNDNENGHFAATATLPHAGYWSWQVTLQNLDSDHMPVTLAVRTAGGQLPAFDSATALTAIDRAKSEIRNEVATQFGGQIEQLSVELVDVRNQLAVMSTQADTLRADMENGNGGLPLLAVISLAVLSGAVAGFAMSWLAGRPGPTPKVTLNTAPRGVDPA